MTKTLTLALVALLALVQVDLWFGKGGLPRTVQLRSQLEQQHAVNDLARARNAQLAAEVRDLKEGLEMVEEKARAELGMVKADEILVQVSPTKR
jgi:cell division protein FtsB